MKFISNQSIKIRIGDIHNCYWKTVKKGEVVELSQETGKALGFSVKTTEGKLGNKKVETKQIDTDKNTDDFFKELIKIKGIGKKTAKDIIRIFPGRENLKKHIQNNENIPIRDDIENLLIERYSK